MDEIKLEDFSTRLPHKLPISVIIEKRPSDHAWADFTYEAIGVVTSEQSQDDQIRRTLKFVNTPLKSSNCRDGLLQPISLIVRPL